MTEQGQVIKNQIVEQLATFEVKLKQWKDSRQPSLADELKAVVLEIGLLMMLSNQLNSESFRELKNTIEQTTPAISNQSSEIAWEVVWYMDTDWFDLEFGIFDIFN